MKRTVPQSQMAENMTTSIFLIGNEFHFRPPPFAIGSETEKRKHRADATRKRKRRLKFFAGGCVASSMGLLSRFTCARVALAVHEVCLSMLGNGRKLPQATEKYRRNRKQKN